MGWAARANPLGPEKRARGRDRSRGRQALYVLRGKIAAGEPLSVADHRLIGRCGPVMRAWLNVTPETTRT